MNCIRAPTNTAAPNLRRSTQSVLLVISRYLSCHALLADAVLPDLSHGISTLVSLLARPFYQDLVDCYVALSLASVCPFIAPAVHGTTGPHPSQLC